MDYPGGEEIALAEPQRDTGPPLLRQGLLDEATELHALAMRRIDKNEKFLPAVAEQLLVLLRTHDQTRAVRLIDRHVGKACATIDDMARMRFYQAAALTLQSVAGKPLKLKLPASLPCFRDDHTYDPADLAGWFQTEADHLADRFDTRNGNGYHRGLNAESRVLVGA